MADTSDDWRAKRDAADADPGPHLTRLGELLDALAELVNEQGRALVVEAREQVTAQIEAQRQERVTARHRAGQAARNSYYQGRGRG